ncbi:MAG: OsmC family protein [Bacteroidota bacterium]
MKRTASATWSGPIKGGQGSISTASGVLADTPYGFQTRFENQPGTNPEELIGAAHAGCFTMALAAQLGEAGLRPERLMTTATVSLDKVGDGYSISAVHLDLVARVPGASRQDFMKRAEQAKTGCPVSKLFNTSITLDAKLEE